MSKRLKHGIDAHAKTEAGRRQARQKMGTPKRDDVGRAVLHAMLRGLQSHRIWRSRKAYGATQSVCWVRRYSTRERPSG